ncbi:TPA: hypothetical protein HA337_03590 [Desulfurococcaceae archaeon]|nr:hypothetical protein [Desulfurococcaceae archaeon]
MRVCKYCLPNWREKLDEVTKKSLKKYVRWYLEEARRYSRLWRAGKLDLDNDG